MDLGGGCGFYAHGFARLGAGVTLIDLDEQSCKFARSRFPGEFRVVHGDPVQLSAGDTYDVVFCNQVIEHYPQLDPLVEAIERYLRPGGVAVITTPNQRCKEFWVRPEWWFT